MLLCICRGPRKGANYCTAETVCRLTAKFTIRKADQDTNNWYVCTLCWYSATFSWCTLCWYLGTFSLLYTLLVSWYVLLVVHFVDNLVRIYVFLVVHFVGIRDWLHKTPARQLAQISWEHPQGHYNCTCHGNFHALDGNR